MDVSVSRVEWRVQPSDAEHVDLTLVVDGGSTKLGSIEATPETCAMLRAAAKVTEMLCGTDSFVATVQPAEPGQLGEMGELVVTHAGREVKEIPIGPSIAITVAPYQIPETRVAN